MTVEIFFEKFDRFMDAPGAAGKMRELVLDLAVKGKLVEQNPNDGPAEASVSLVTRAAEKAIRDGTIRRHDFNKNSDDSDLPELPPGWRWTRLFEVTRPVPYAIKRGPFGSAIRKDMFVSEGFKVYEQQHAISGDFTKGRYYIDNAKFEQLAAFELHPNEILVSCSGTVGKVAIVPSDIERGIINQALLKLSLHQSALLNEYFLVLFPAFFMETDTLTNLSGTAQKNIPGIEVLKTMPFPLPPLTEQKRIVAKVDELMALCDRLEAQQRERETRHAALARASLARFAEAPTPANLNFLFHKSYPISPADLRKSILTLAVQGKLVPQEPNDEPAEELLKTIAIKRTKLFQKGYPNRDESSTQIRKQASQALPGNLSPLAPGWAWATLIQVSLLVVDCHNKTAPYTASGIRLLRTTNIRDGRLNLSEPKFVNDATYERWSARCKPDAGDILITREAPMGEVCVIPDGMKVCLGQRMMLIRVVPETMNTKYLLYSLMAPDLMERVQDKPVGATVQHLRVGGVETLLTPVPPLAEQRRIVAKVDQLMALVDELETQLAASRTTSANLFDAIVAELTTKPAYDSINGFETVPVSTSHKRSGAKSLLSIAR